MFMLDTDICVCVYVMNERHDALSATFAEHAHEICISAVTHAELWFGVEYSAQVEHNRSQLDGFLRDLDIRPFDVEAGQHCGRIRELLTRRGTPIGANDLLIAAHARSMGAALVTNNSRELGRVPDLETVSWARCAP